MSSKLQHHFLVIKNDLIINLIDKRVATLIRWINITIIYSRELNYRCK